MDHPSAAAPPPDLGLPSLDLNHLQNLGKTAAAAVSGAQGRPRDGAQQAQAERIYAFSIDFTDKRGGRWAGDFVNHIATLGETEMIGIKRAHGFRGLEFEALTPVVFNLMYMVTHLDVTLDKRPDWAKDLWALYDLDLIQAIWKEVSGHEDRFHRTEPPAATGEEKP